MRSPAVWTGRVNLFQHLALSSLPGSLHSTLANRSFFVADSEGSSLLTYACDSKVILGGVPIQVKADETGTGEITIGESHYAIDFDVEKSGGVVCQARWNDDVAVVECGT
jgi:hypothetical protein